MSRAEDAREDILFRTGYLASPPPGQRAAATAYPAGPPAGVIGGLNLGYSSPASPHGGYISPANPHAGIPIPSPVGATGAPSYSTPAAAPGVGGGLGSGMTGGQLATSILAGGLAFMGGYRRQPGLTALALNMNEAVAAELAVAEQQRAIQSAIPEGGIVTPDDARTAKNRLLQMGRIDDAMKFAQEENRLQQLVEADENQFLRAMAPSMAKNMEIFREYDRTKQITNNFTRDPKTFSDEERRAIVIAYAKIASPEALSDNEFRRNIRDASGNIIWEVAKTFFGFGALVPSDDVASNLINTIRDGAKAAQDNQAWMEVIGNMGGKNLDLPNYPFEIKTGPTARYKHTPSSARAKKGITSAIGEQAGGIIEGVIQGANPATPWRGLGNRQLGQ